MRALLIVTLAAVTACQQESPQRTAETRRAVGAEVAARPLEAALHGVYVGVDEAGGEQAAREVDGAVRGGQVGRVGQHRSHPAVLDHDPTHRTAVTTTVEQGTVAEDGGDHG